MEKEVQERFMIETQLRKALENQELSLCFQPIVELPRAFSAGNMKRIKENIGKIKDLGIKLSMDDFGTGYSSFAMLLNLQIDKLKIDKMFIDNIGKMREEKIIRTILSIAKELGLKVVAEGIETEKQLKFLKDKCLSTLNNYLFSVFF